MEQAGLRAMRVGAPANRSESNMPKELYHIIGGTHVPGKSGRFGDVYNPATGEVASRVPLASAEEVDRAVRTAAAAFPAWAVNPASKRAAVMFAMRELVAQHVDTLAELIGR